MGNDKTQTNLARRQLLKSAVGTGAAMATTPLLAAATPSQTEGPFFPIQSQTDTDADMTRIHGHGQAAQGKVVTISGRVLDEDGRAVADAVVDIWQANANGRYAHEADSNPAPLDEHFQGWAKLKTDTEGRYRVRTIVPGAYPVADDWHRPPHIHFKVARRGYHELTTQMYFAGEPLNDTDRLLQSHPQPERDRLLVAFQSGEGNAPHGVFDLVLEKV
jgi:protocatechuate 3,4-dioxygenase beta subunit